MMKTEKGAAIDPKWSSQQRQHARLLVLYSHVNENTPKNQWVDVAA
ncbi:hypothetical protein [Halomonas sp. YLGW01]|nr:hypothetical protein [Halomonas sp. YLGW01]